MSYPKLVLHLFPVHGIRKDHVTRWARTESQTGSLLRIHKTIKGVGGCSALISKGTFLLHMPYLVSK